MHIPQYVVRRNNYEGFVNTTDYLCESKQDFLNIEDINAKDWIFYSGSE